MTPWPAGIFVVGTDTGVGKTRVAAAVARTWMRAGLRVGVLKPVSTGADDARRSPDVEALIAAISTEGSPFPPPPRDRVGPLIFTSPLAPPVAARREGVRLEPDAVIEAATASIEWWATVARAERIIVEGIGGLLCPLAETGWTVADLAIQLDYPLLLVARRGLGTLNHTLLAMEAAESRGLRVAGILLNATTPGDDPLAEATNAAELARLLPDTPILADWAYDPHASHVPVAPDAENWINLAWPPRPVGARGGTRSAAPTSVLLDSGDDLLAPATQLGLVGSSSSTSATTPGDVPFTLAAGSDPSHSGLSGLNLDLTAPRRMTPTTHPDDGELSDLDSAGSSRRNVLLLSYASAVTLALGWTLYRNRGDRRPTRPDVFPAEAASPVVNNLGERSRRVAELKPIPADRLIALGSSRQIDALLVEPLAIERKNLTLERVNFAGKTERRDGGKQAVLLRVRLQNRSTDRVFAPVDPAFVRGRSDDVYETLLVLDDGRKIYPDPLAVSSEWTVAGESFADLRPGETREVTFATEPNAPAGIENQPGVWRIKLRTGTEARPGVETTAEVGIRLPGRASR